MVIKHQCGMVSILAEFNMELCLSLDVDFGHFSKFKSFLGQEYVQYVFFVINHYMTTNSVLPVFVLYFQL